MHVLFARLKLAPLLLASILAIPAAAQAGAPAAAADPYAAEPAVVVHLDTVSHMQADGTGSLERAGAVRVQSEAMLKQFSVLAIPFAGNSEKVEFQYARVHHPDGTVTETPAFGMLEEPSPVTREAPFYSDLKTAELPIRGLRVGDTLEWQSRTTLFKPLARNQFWGQESFLPDIVVLQESYELQAPAGVRVQVWSNPRSGAKFTQSVVAGEAVYRWMRQSLKPTVGAAADAEREAAKKRTLTPDEVSDAQQGKLPDIAWTTFPDWAAVGAWYRSLELDRTAPDAAVEAKVAELTAGKTMEEDKVRAVYSYVSTQVHYIGVAFGIGRYQPHTAAEVLGSQYGDCKDKHTLLAAMLRVLGLHPDAVLIGAGVRFNPAVPAPQSFNHLITRVVVAGNPVWLDSTAEVAPYRLLSAPLRDKEALVIPEAGPATLQRTPAAVPFPFVDTMTAKGSLDAQGTVVSHITLSYRGDTELFLRAIVRQITPAQYDELTQKLVASMGYGGTISHSEFSRVDDTAEPFTVSFDYRREKGGDWDNHQVVAELAPVQLPLLDAKDPPLQPVDLLQPRTETSHAEMQLPPGWRAELPEAVHQSSPFVTYDLTYGLSKGVLTADRRVVILQKQVPLADWKTYKAWQDAVNLGTEPFVQLNTPPGDTHAAGEGGNHAATEGGAAPSSADASSAAESLRTAENQIRLRQFDLAQGSLDKTRALDADLRGLWNEYGYLEFSRGNSDAAMRDYRKELALHPGEIWTLRALAGLEVSTHHTPEALDTLRTWAEAAPNDPVPIQGEARLLLDAGRPAGAVAVLQKGLAAAGPDAGDADALKLSLGHAEIKAGMPQQATATLTPLLESHSSSNLNTAAYELADANLVLPADEAAERRVLSRLDAETNSWTLNETLSTLQQSSSLLAASWDTMGWILFREGKPAEALPYLEAARLSRNGWIIPEHLGEVRLALRDEPGALADFEEAAAMVSRVDQMGVHTAPTPEVKALDARVAELKTKTKASSLVRPGSQGGRTFPLGGAEGRSAHAEYRLLLSRNKVEGFLSTTATTVPGDAVLLARFKTAAFFPTDSTARLVKTAFLNCQGTICELVLER